VSHDVALARRLHRDYVEVGGWAVAEASRFTMEAFDIALSTYALAGLIGGCIGITTATSRNASARILRKLGGSPLGHDGREVPAYFDPEYRCEMEVLRFDSAAPNPRYRAQIAQMTERLLDVPVLGAGPVEARGAAAARSEAVSRMERFPLPGVTASPALLPAHVA
jgi:hypothetical protein